MWADHERRKLFATPNYSHAENIELYDKLNKTAAELLQQGKSVIFDTNFNFFRDREKLRTIAQANGAKTVLLWVTTPKDIARGRATDNAHRQATRVLGNMPVSEFDRMSGNLEPPSANEAHIEVDGTKISEDYIKELLAIER